MSQYWFSNVSFFEALIWLHSKNKKKKENKEREKVNPVTRNQLSHIGGRQQWRHPELSLPLQIVIIGMLIIGVRVNT